MLVQANPGRSIRKAPALQLTAAFANRLRDSKQEAKLARPKIQSAFSVNRLSNGRLELLPGDVARPRYDLDALSVGIVHLGVGAFHRAHQAVFFDDRLSAGETGWAICGASLRSAETREALQPQDGLYTVAVRGPEREDLRVIGALRALLVAPEDPQRLLAAMS